MVKALVTGGTGFVGSHIARELDAQGHSVRVMHRATSRLTALDGVNYESVIATLDDAGALRAACDGVDWVFHVAAVADYWRADRQRMFAANVDGTRLLLQAAREAGVRRVVFTSSAAAVGLRDDRPADESEPFNLPPERFPYGYSKHLAEQVVAEAVRDGQDVVTVNPVVVLGPGDLNLISGDLILKARRLGPLLPVTSGGLAVVDVRDVARWHVAAAERGRSGERYILGTANYGYRELFDKIAETLGVLRPRFTLPDWLPPLLARLIDVARAAGIVTPIDANQALLATRNVFFDYRKTWDELGAPHIDMRRSLRDTDRWYAENGYR